MASNNPKLIGLKYIINLHKICGISYLGHQIERENDNKFIILFVKILVISWNFIQLSFMCITLIIAFSSGEKMSEITEIANHLNAKKSSIIIVIISIGPLLQMSQTVFDLMHLLIRGKTILKHLVETSQTVRVDDNIERKIGRNIAVTH